MPRSHDIPGYSAPIYRALWESILCAGVPRMWFRVWGVLCAALGLTFLTYVGVLWILVPLALWAAGQGSMMLLTLWDPQWPDLLLAQLTRQYRETYEA